MDLLTTTRTLQSISTLQHRQFRKCITPNIITDTSEDTIIITTAAMNLDLDRILADLEQNPDLVDQDMNPVDITVDTTNIMAITIQELSEVVQILEDRLEVSVQNLRLEVAQILEAHLEVRILVVAAQTSVGVLILEAHLEALILEVAQILVAHQEVLILDLPLYLLILE